MNLKFSEAASLFAMEEHLHWSHKTWDVATSLHQLHIMYYIRAQIERLLNTTCIRIPILKS